MPHDRLRRRRRPLLLAALLALIPAVAPGGSLAAQADEPAIDPWLHLGRRADGLRAPEEGVALIGALRELGVVARSMGDIEIFWPEVTVVRVASRPDRFLVVLSWPNLVTSGGCHFDVVLLERGRGVLERPDVDFGRRFSGPLRTVVVRDESGVGVECVIANRWSGDVSSRTIRVEGERLVVGLVVRLPERVEGIGGDR